MKYFPLLIFLFTACGCSDSAPEESAPEETSDSDLNCISWFHDCNCTHVCTTESAYNARLENGEGNCDVFCDPAAQEDAPAENCEEIEGICQFASE